MPALYLYQHRDNYNSGGFDCQKDRTALILKGQIAEVGWRDHNLKFAHHFVENILSVWQKKWKVKMHVAGHYFVLWPAIIIVPASRYRAGTFYCNLPLEMAEANECTALFHFTSQDGRHIAIVKVHAQYTCMQIIQAYEHIKACHKLPSTMPQAAKHVINCTKHPQATKQATYHKLARSKVCMCLTSRTDSQFRAGPLSSGSCSSPADFQDPAHVASNLVKGGQPAASWANWSECKCKCIADRLSG